MTARPARRLLAGLAAAMLLSGGALAQAPAQAPAQTGTPPQPAAPGQPPSAQDLLTGGDQPLVVEADNGIEWRRNENVYIARGNARAVRGGVELLADVLKAYYRDKKNGGSGQEIYRIDAIDNVRITTQNERAFGDKGIYHADDGVFVLRGDNLKLESGQGTITARDSLEYWEKRQLAVARGNAVVVSEDKRLRADVLTAHIRQDKNGKQEIQQVDAFGNVHVSTPTEIARGDEGVYNLRTGMVTLCGDVKITREKNQLNGQCAEVNLRTGISRLLGGGGRVRGLIKPSQ